MIDEKELIKIIQIVSDKIEEYLEPEEVNIAKEAANNLIEIIDYLPKIEFSAYGSENCNSEDTTPAVRGD